MENREGGGRRVTDRILIDHISSEKDWSGGVDYSGIETHTEMQMRREPLHKPVNQDFMNNLRIDLQRTAQGKQNMISSFKVIILFLHC